ncbi:MAG: hypothetical protein ACWA5U_02620 [bacterium]
MTPAFVLPATQVGLPLLPMGAAVLGGILAWKLWQQQQQNKKQQAALNEQLEALKDQINHQQAQTSAAQKTSEQAPQKENTVNQSTAQTSQPSSTNYGLFEQLIDDNIALRQNDQ